MLAELFRIDAICLWCTVVHALTVALFAVLALGAALRPIDPPEPPLRDPGTPPPATTLLG